MKDLGIVLPYFSTTNKESQYSHQYMIYRKNTGKLAILNSNRPFAIGTIVDGKKIQDIQEHIDSTERVSLERVTEHITIPLGSKVIIPAKPGGGKSTIASRLGDSFAKHTQVTRVLFNERETDSLGGNTLNLHQGLDEEVIMTALWCAVGECAIGAFEGEHHTIILDSLSRVVRTGSDFFGNSGKILSGGIDPSILSGVGKLLNLARNTKSGSLTIIGTALLSKVHAVSYEALKGISDVEIFPEMINNSYTRK